MSAPASLGFFPASLPGQKVDGGKKVDRGKSSPRKKQASPPCELVGVVFLNKIKFLKKVFLNSD